MMAEAGFDLVLVALIVGAALFAVTVRDLFGAVIFFVVYGVFVALAWLRLDALDVALTEAALGAGLTGVLLISAVARLSASQAGETHAPDPRPVPAASPAMRGLALLVALGVSGALGFAFLTLSPNSGLRPQVAGNIALSGVNNPVTAVLLNFRGWDTLLESVVLLAALVGLWSLARDRSWGRRPGMRQHARQAGVLATFGRLLPPFGLLLGVYMVWVGADLPGGAFQGGTVLAAVWLLVMMAGLLPAPLVTSPRLRGGLIIGPLVFLGVGMLGALSGSIWGTGTFLGLPPGFAKALILAIEAGLTLSIAVTLALLVLGPPELPVAGTAGRAGKDGGDGKAPDPEPFQ